MLCDLEGSTSGALPLQAWEGHVHGLSPPGSPVCFSLRVALQLQPIFNKGGLQFPTPLEEYRSCSDVESVE